MDITAYLQLMVEKDASDLYFSAGKITVDAALQHADSRNNLRLRLRLENPAQFQNSGKLEMGNGEEKPIYHPRRP